MSDMDRMRTIYKINNYFPAKYEHGETPPMDMAFPPISSLQHICMARLINYYMSKDELADLHLPSSIKSDMTIQLILNKQYLNKIYQVLECNFDIPFSYIENLIDSVQSDTSLRVVSDYLFVAFDELKVGYSVLLHDYYKD